MPFPENEKGGSGATNLIIYLFFLFDRAQIPMNPTLPGPSSMILASFAFSFPWLQTSLCNNSWAVKN